MKHSINFLLLLISVFFSLNAFAQGGGEYVSDWAVGQNTVLENNEPGTGVKLPENNDSKYVSDWQMIDGPSVTRNTAPFVPFLNNNEIIPNGKYVVPWEMHPEDPEIKKEQPAVIPDADEEQRKLNEQYFSEWTELGMTNVEPVPASILDAEKIYFEDMMIRMDQEDKAKIKPKKEYSIKDDFIPKLQSLFTGGAPRDTYSKEFRDEQGVLKQVQVFNTETDELVELTVCQYDAIGTLTKNITEYYPGKIISKQYQLKNDKLEGTYQKYSLKTGKLIISCFYIDGELDGTLNMFYSETGNLRKLIKFKKGLKTASAEYDTDGTTLLAQNKYDVNGKILKTFDYNTDGVVTTETNYGWKPQIRKIECNALSKAQIPATTERQVAFITQVKKVTGAQMPVELLNEDVLLWHVDAALTYIVNKINDNTKLGAEELELIFDYGMFDMLSTLADHYEYYGDREGKPTEIRYRTLLLGAIVGDNTAKYKNVGMDQYAIVIDTYERLNLMNTTYSTDNMMKYLEDQSIVEINNELLKTTISVSNNIIKTNTIFSKPSKAVLK